MVCQSLDLGGLGLLNKDNKFARALRFCWLWFEWKEPSKIWIGMGNPCYDMDKKLYYASTTITVGNGAQTPFWESHRVQNRKPTNIAPLIYEASTRKNWKVREALKDGAWIFKIKIASNFSIAHLR